MSKKLVLYKSLVIGVIVLFIGVGVQPAIAIIQSDNNDVEYINITSEFSGLRKKHTVKMSQQRVEELDAFFDSYLNRLDNSQSDEETSMIINEAIMLLDGYDLLCGLSVEQVKRRFLQYNELDIDSDYIPAEESSNCFIMGRTTCTFIFSPLFGIMESVYGLLSDENESTLLFGIIFFVFFKQITLAFGFPLFPLRIGSHITMGTEFRNWPDYKYNSAEGWITSIGIKGKNSWNGKFAGTLGSHYGWWTSFFIGIKGFFGLRLYNPQNATTTLIGYARNVGIEYT
jgi:hypothetical protein